MKKIGLFLPAFFLFILSACSNDDDHQKEDFDYLIFGHYYGMCAGETCVETFKLTDSGLYEDSNDVYAMTGEFDFHPLDEELFEQVKDLVDYFPSKLLSSEETVFGCPDCADAGGLYIEISKEGTVKSWRLDQIRRNDVPEYLHEFMDKVNEKIRLINPSIALFK